MAEQFISEIEARGEVYTVKDSVLHDKLGARNGIATLDANGCVPTSQLPSYVDDVIEGTYDEANSRFLDLEGNPYTPEGGKIYIDVNTRKTYRWSGTVFVPIGSSLELGVTSTTAFPGNRGLALEQELAALSQGSMTYRGKLGIDGDVTELPTTYKRGDTYLVKTAGTYSGKECDEGDFLICTKDNIVTVATIPTPSGGVNTNYDKYDSSLNNYIIYQYYNKQTGENEDIYFAAMDLRNTINIYFGLQDGATKLYFTYNYYAPNIKRFRTKDNGVTWTSLDSTLYGAQYSSIFTETETRGLKILHSTVNIYNNDNSIYYSINPYSLEGYDTDWAIIQGNVEGGLSTQDIVDNLTSDAADLPLSARQGKILNGLLSNAVHFKGTVGEGGDIIDLPVRHSKGDLYLIKTAGTYAEQNCEKGDFLLSVKDSEAKLISMPTGYDSAVYNNYIIYQHYNPSTDTYGKIEFIAMKDYFYNDQKIYCNIPDGDTYRALHGMGNSYISSTIDNGTTWATPSETGGFARYGSATDQFVFLYSNINIYDKDGSVYFSSTPFVAENIAENWAVIQGNLETGGSGDIPDNIQEQLDGKVSKSGDTMSGALEISSSNFPMINLTRSGSSYFAGIKFNNNLGVLGGLGMTAVDGALTRFKSDISTKYDILDTGNYSDYAVPKTGGTMTGALTVKANVNTPALADNTGDAMLATPTAGAFMQSDASKGFTATTPTIKSFIGSINMAANSTWYNLINVRHRNGASDGTNHGMYIQSLLTRTGDLIWNKQYSGTWQGERTILDSGNYSTQIPSASTSASGLMTAAMVTKLNGIAEGANKITVDSSMSSSSTNPVQNKVVNTALASKATIVKGSTSSSSTTWSFSCTAGSDYLLTLTTASGMGGFYTITSLSGGSSSIAIKTTGTTGSISTSISGTTITFTFAGTTTVSYKYIQLK